MDGLRAAAESLGGDSPSIDQVARDAARLESGTGKTDVVLRAQTDLAMKAFLDGDPGRARRLLPARGGAAPARDVLGDRRQRQLGAGGECGWAGGRAVARGRMRRAGSPCGPPPGILKLRPDGTGGSW